MREAMAPFKPHKEGGMELEKLLTLIDQADHSPPERHHVLMLARQARSTADRIEEYDPGKNRAEWRKSAGEMRFSAVLLAQATDENDEPACTRRGPPPEHELHAVSPGLPPVSRAANAAIDTLTLTPPARPPLPRRQTTARLTTDGPIVR